MTADLGRSLVYLAVPITHPDQAVVGYRISCANAAAVALHDAGIPVFSPASHSESFIRLCETRQPWEYWAQCDLPILERCCSMLVVLGLEGWMDSVGVGAEIKAANRAGIDITVVSAVAGKNYGGLADLLKNLEESVILPYRARQIVPCTIAAVTGGRYDPTTRQPYILTPHCAARLLALLDLLGVTALAHGAAIGYDRQVALLVTERRPRITVTAYPVDSTFDGDPSDGGMMRRNRRMLVSSGAEVLIALPGANGTANCVSEAASLGLEIWEWQGERHEGEFVKTAERRGEQKR